MELQYKVTRAFFDREDNKKFYRVGDQYNETSKERSEYLSQKGYIQASGPTEGLINLGGGYFQLPSGDKVRGRDKAEKALTELLSGDLLGE